MDNPPELLCGWKKIASHLGISVRSAQRYARGWGLPVHKAANSKRAAVFATTDELNAWVATRPSPTLPSTIETTIHELHQFTSQLHALQIENLRLLEELNEKASHFKKIQNAPLPPIWDQPAKRIIDHSLTQP